MFVVVRRALLCGVLLIIGSNCMAAPITTVNVSDFMAGNKDADAAKIGGSKWSTEKEIESLFGGEWEQVAKYWKYSGLTSSSEVNLDIKSKTSGPGFDWSIDAADLNKLNDTVFAVHQYSFKHNKPSGWVAYLFEDLADASGMFYTHNSFNKNKFMKVKVYTNKKPTTPGGGVPELDASSSVLAISLFVCVIGYVRERKRS